MCDDVVICLLLSNMMLSLLCGVAGNPDYVLDCIDDVRTKCELLTYCVQHNIRVITSFGAGAKADPSQLHIALDYADVTRECACVCVCLSDQCC